MDTSKTILDLNICRDNIINTETMSPDPENPPWY